MTATLAIVALAVLVLGAGAVLCYAARIEARRFGITRLELYPAGWPAALDGFTILHFSDLHSRGDGPGERFLASLPEQLGEPDLVLCSGDFAEHVEALPAFLPVLAKLSAKHGKYAVFGNNDIDHDELCNRLRAGLTEAGFTVLHESAVRLEHDGQGLWLGGFGFRYLKGFCYRYSFPLKALFGQAPPGEPRLLVSHTPDLLPEAAGAQVAVLLCGHTHGGQVCRPNGQPYRTNLFRFVCPAFGSGLYEVDGLLLYVNRGVGMTGPQVRTWCPPEVALLTLRAQNPRPG